LMIQNIRESAAQYQRDVKIAMDLAGPKIRTSDIPQSDIEQDPYLILKQGDLITLRDHKGEDPNLYTPESISSSYPGLPSLLQIGERIFFDDGKIEGQIMSQNDNEVTILITKSKPGGAKLKPDKGINIPDTTRHISGLTEKDKTDFRFIAGHADIVNFSFVNSPKDLEELFLLIDQYEAHDLGIVLKIETKRAFNNLYRLLHTTMSRKNPIGVMIARGDLAIEAGWENIGYVQNEILRICAAAHLPVVWATQVLENFAKKGMPSRSELSDISQSMKADCVMLNKGPYIVEALSFLDRLLTQGESFQNKNLTMLPSLKELL
jgi:pyruvate kinase